MYANAFRTTRTAMPDMPGRTGRRKIRPSPPVLRFQTRGAAVLSRRRAVGSGGGVKLSKQACESLYREHAPAASRRALRLLGSLSDADEVVHDVFLRLFEQPIRFLGQSRLSTYL